MRDALYQHQLLANPLQIKAARLHALETRLQSAETRELLFTNEADVHLLLSCLQFLATAFYHNAAAAKGLTAFDKNVFAASKKAALREFSALAASVENGGSATKEFNNTFALSIERPPIGAPSQNLRIAAEPLPEKRQELAAIFGKCAWYHSNQSGRTPEEREQRRAHQDHTGT
jgi:hypothetical protein